MRRRPCLRREQRCELPNIDHARLIQDQRVAPSEQISPGAGSAQVVVRQAMNGLGLVTRYLGGTPRGRGRDRHDERTGAPVSNGC